MKVKHPFQRGHRYFCTSQKVKGSKRLQRLPFYHALTIDHNPNGNDLWWNETKKKWGTFTEFKETHDSYGTHKENVTSLKAAMRHIRKHDELPKGTKVRLCSNFVGCDVIITK